MTLLMLASSSLQFSTYDWFIYTIFLLCPVELVWYNQESNKEKSLGSLASLLIKEKLSPVFDEPLIVQDYFEKIVLLVPAVDGNNYYQRAAFV